jgi:hypothetical protein
MYVFEIKLNFNQYRYTHGVVLFLEVNELIFRSEIDRMPELTAIRGASRMLCNKSMTYVEAISASSV